MEEKNTKNAISLESMQQIIPSPAVIAVMVRSLQSIASGKADAMDMAIEARETLDILASEQGFGKSLPDLLDQAWMMGRDHVAETFDETARKISGFSEPVKRSLGHAVVEREAADQKNRASRIRGYQPPADLADQIMAPLLPLFASPSGDDAPAL